MEIKVLGTGCPNCQTLEKKVREVVKEHSIDAKITKVTDIMDIMAYKVMSTPALVVNEIVVSKGRIPNEKELLDFLKS
jgi:small redox-active disulfide protein 2